MQLARGGHAPHARFQSRLLSPEYLPIVEAPARTLSDGRNTYVAALIFISAPACRQMQGRIFIFRRNMPRLLLAR
jgi:hypothetical protein